jgi:hypothetical protein
VPVGHDIRAHQTEAHAAINSDRTVWSREEPAAAVITLSSGAENMALLKRELYRQVKGPEVTHADRCALVFDTDSKSLYVEREVAHLEALASGTVDYQTATMDIADYLRQGGQTAGHRELWRLLRALFGEDSESVDRSDATSTAG